MSNVHHLKTWTPYFQDIKSGIKKFEVRKNDRDFQVGDTLILDDFNPITEKYTGAWIPKLITYKLEDERFVKGGFVILGVEDIIV
jgi:ASC-1-like (ASCH) protein